MIVVFGGNGWIGSNVVHRLRSEGQAVRAVVRGELQGGDIFAVNGYSDLLRCLKDAEVVIYAIRDFSIRAATTPSEELFCLMTVFESARDAGVKKFIYLSTVKVFGESTDGSTPFTVDSVPNPSTPYGRWKLDSELLLDKASTNSDIKIHIVRFPLVLGRGAAGYLGIIMKLSRLKLPLLWPSSENKRSYVEMTTLVSYISKVASSTYESGVGGTVVICERHPLTSLEIILRQGQLEGVKLYTVTLPPALNHIFRKTIGRFAPMRRLFSSLEVESSVAPSD